LKLQSDELLSNFAFKFNLRRYSLALAERFTRVFDPTAGAYTRPLLSSS
jgi:hypothetical protein